MKKLFIVAIFAVLMMSGLPIFAQDKKEKQKENDSEYYYKNISLERIYLHQRGYVVQYRKGVNGFERAYIPIEWFESSAGKGEIINLPPGNVWPSMSVYYKDGAFSHVRLYVHRSPSHRTWGTIPQGTNLDSRFEGVEDLQLKF